MTEKDLGQIIPDILATATVDNKVGKPAVNVTVEQINEVNRLERKFNFEFVNMKGDKGDTPVKGVDYLTEEEKQQFTTETLSLVTAEGAKQVKAVTDKGAEEVSKVTTEGNKQISLTQAEALKVIEQLKKLVEGNPETSNAQTLSGKTRVEFEQDTEKVREELEEKANDNIILINKFDINSLKIGYFSGTGEILTQEGITTNYSERYIPIKNGTKYVWTKEFYIIGSGIDSQQIVIATYDINKKFLERVFINKLDTNTKTFNSNVAFIRLSFYDCEANKKFMFCENELPKTYIPYIYYLNYDSVYGLEKNINSKIDTNNLLINDETNKKIYTFVDSIYSPNNEWDNVHEQYYGDGKFGLVSNPSYVTYALKIKKITKIYFPEPSKLYCSICIYDNHEYKNGKRYRNTDNENTLPTTTLNAVEVREGEYILVTCHKDYRNFSMCMINYVEALNKELLLHNNHIIQVKKEILDLMPKKWKIKYTESLNFAQARKATIDLYIPINKNYLHFEIIETYRDSETSSNPSNPTSSSNSNVWKIKIASICDNKLNKKFNITANGEWECAIKLKNKEVDDFMGGDAHGDEVKETVVFIINGRPVDITTFTKLTDIDSFKFIQTSSLYKPDDKATLSTRSQFTPVATHGSEHIFTENGVIVNQSVLWHEEVTVVQGYLCMMLNAKDVVDKMYTNADYGVIDLSNKNKYNLEKLNVNKITQYSDSNNKGVIASVTVNRIKGMNDKGTQCYISVGDNGGGIYHKCYLPLFYNMSGEIVQKNTLWECSSKYEYEFG